MAYIVMGRDEAREFVAQCFRLRHAHPRWRLWLRIALREARK
jgi:hypothetical protein